MRIAVIGMGRVGSVLGTRWAQGGHAVTFGVRRPESEEAQAVVNQAPGAKAAAVGAAVRDAEVVVLAIPWEATRDAIQAAGDLGGKILVDATNPLLPGFQGLAIGTTTSAAEQVAALAPGARVVKAFNTTGAPNMANPAYPSGPITMYIAGDDVEAKQVVAGLAQDLGFTPLDTGPLMAARYLEPLAMLWIHLAFRQGFGPTFALTLTRRGE